MTGQTPALDYAGEPLTDSEQTVYNALIASVTGLACIIAVFAVGVQYPPTNQPPTPVGIFNEFGSLIGHILIFRALLNWTFEHLETAIRRSETPPRLLGWLL